MDKKEMQTRRYQSSKQICAELFKIFSKDRPNLHCNNIRLWVKYLEHKSYHFETNKLVEIKSNFDTLDADLMLIYCY